MPTTPRKVHENREGMSRGTSKLLASDSDDDDMDMPSLIPCSEEEDSDAEEFRRKAAGTNRKTETKPKPVNANSNAECAEMWYRLSKDEKEKHIHVMKIYLLSPFLFGQVVNQEDKWINWAHEFGLLPTKSSFDIRALEEKYFNAVDLVEEAFDKLADNALRKNKDGLIKVLDIIGSSGLKMSQHLDKAISSAESFKAFGSLRNKIELKPGMTKKQGDIALLLAHNQVSLHVKDLASGTDIADAFIKECTEREKDTTDKKMEGNAAFAKGKYKAAISAYTLALRSSPYNHVLFGNRAQSYLKTQEPWCALADGRRAVVLKADWHKAQYRYAQAFFEIGNIKRAKETNRKARKICVEKKDLDTQLERFEKSIQSTREVKGKTGANKIPAKQSKQLYDLPDLVTPTASDTSENSDYEKPHTGPPDLIDEDEESKDSSESEDLNSDSSDVYESADSSSRKKPNSATEQKKKKSNKVRQALREKVLDQAKQELKANRAKMKTQLAAKAASIKKGKGDKKAKVRVELYGTSPKRQEFIAFLKQGSKAILEKKCMLAVQNYSDAMGLLEQHDFQYKVFDLKEIDFVILLYGFGAAYLELGGHEELLEAKKQFDIILVKHKNVVFPLAYLGVGRVFQKQNRFIEALDPLEKGLTVVNKFGEDLAVYRWPGSHVIIDETRSEKLLIEIETLIRECRNPPRPDAVCRYPDCASKSHIYLSDPDYKGYIRLVCSEECKVDFHPVCWKKHKGTQQENTGDKDFLEGSCMTPDCTGNVIKIQIFDSDGLKTEFKHEKLSVKVETKPKATKQNKVKAGGIGHKQKKKKEKEENKIDDALTADADTGEEKETAKPIPTSAAQKEDKTVNEDHSRLEKVGCEGHDVNPGMQAGEGVFILRKEDDDEPTKGGGKTKTKKKKPKNTQTLDEFLKDRGGQQTFRPGLFETTADLDEITPHKGKFNLGPPPPGWSQHEMEAPFAIPPHLQEDTAQFEASYMQQGLKMFSVPPVTFPQPEINLQAVTDYVSSMLQEILRASGPLELADPNIMQPLSMLPDSYQDIISNAGGLRPILEKSGKFVFYQSKVMLPEDKEFEDVLQNMKPQTDNPFLERINRMNDAKVGNSILGGNSIWEVEESEHGSPGDLNFETSSQVKNSSSKFNPNAKEFVPSLSQTDLLHNISSVTSLANDGCTLGDAELPDNEIQEGTTIIAEQREPVLNEGEVNNAVENIAENVVESVATDEKENNGEHSDLSIDTGSEGAVVIEELLIPNGRNVKDSTIDLSVACSNFSSGKQTVSGLEETDTPVTSHKRTGSNVSVSESVVSSKSKSVQTQFNLKSKSVMTDPVTEPFKAEYQRAVAEKDACQAKLQETEKRNALLSKNSAEVDKVKKKLSDALQENEKYAKELQELKQRNSEEIRKLRQQCEDKEDKLKMLNKRLLQDADDKSSSVNNLKKELESCKGQFTSERGLWNKERSEKDELLKNIKLQHQQQQARAQEAEIKLLELRRDVGLRFLERAYQESHITINNLLQAVNARISGPKVEELIATWKNYTVECHQRVVQCKATFNEQIELLKNGSTLASVPHLSIPGPPPYPAIPVLQPLVPGQQQKNQIQPHPPPQSLVENSAFVPRAANPPLSNASAGATVARPGTTGPPTTTSTAVGGGDKPASMAAATAAVPGAVAAAANISEKAKSNSFEKIMLRLSTMYPNLSRLELTGLIKEVRQNKHGSLTGLSLEDIVSSVSELVEKKKKAGVLRPSGSQPSNSPTIQRATKTAAMPQVPQPAPGHSVQPMAKPIAPEVSKTSVVGGRNEDDPCVICHEDMNATNNIVTLECGHRYHSACIRKWLLGEQSTCPTCRVHALLPDEFPRLK